MTTGSVSEEDTRVSGRRYVAHLVDGVIMSLGLVVLLLLLSVLGSSTAADVVLAVAIVAALTVGQVAYFVLTQQHGGQSPGKRLVGIQVVDSAGRVPDRAALVKRTVPLVFEYFYVIALIGMLASPYRQRLGDRWADTYVVEV